MNSNFRYLLILSVALWLFISGCKGSTSGESTSGADDMTNAGLDQPKDNGNTYRMKIESTPDMIELGKQVVFSFTPQIIGKETEPVPLDAERGYEIHLIMVNNDLSWFDHRHPMLSDLGSYELSYTFETGGIYHLFADYKPTGSRSTFQMQSIGVSGSSKLAVKYSEPKLTSVAGVFEVSLSPMEDGKFESGKMQEIIARISKGSDAVDPNTLGDYLGGKAHLVIISVKEMDYLHVHPSVENGNLVFHTNFPRAGLYRAWLQFQTDNIVQAADFVIQVE